MEQLEDRRLLAASALRSPPNVTYHGGPLLQQVQVQSIYEGQAWSLDSNLQQQIQQVDGFLQYFTSSPYMDALKQYNVGAGALVGHDLLPANPPSGTTISDGQIQATLNAEISAGHLTVPTSNSLYVFFTAPGVTVTSNGENSSTGFAGYHSAFTDTAGQPVYYVVVPYPTGSVSSQRLSTFQQDTVILSHELAEAITDPDTQSGWFDQRQGEIGDLAAGTSGMLHGYVVQGVWSQASGRVVVPTDTTSSTVHVTGAPVQAKAGQQLTSIVATISGAPTGSTAASFTATIDWGDGHTSAGTVTADPSGGFDITGTNTYSGAGWYPITVTVDNASGTVVGRALTKASVAPAPPTVVANGTQIQTTAATSFSGTVATFTDARASAAAGDFTATIDWGDGSTSTGTVTVDAKGGFDVGGTHTYASTSQSGAANAVAGLSFFSPPSGTLGSQFFVIRVAIHDTPANASATALTVAKVAPVPPNITANGQNIQATNGRAFSGFVATFTDVNTSAAAGDFKATIAWGDGTTSEGTITANSKGGFDVTGTHTYTSTQSGLGLGLGLGLPFGLGSHNFVVSVTITDTQTKDQATAKSLATVAPTPPNLAVTAQNITATAGQAFTGVVATFTDVDPNATAAGFTATINWGDGTTSTGIITANAKGGFDVTGTHTYATGSDPVPVLQGQRFGLGGDDAVLTVTVKSTTNTDHATSRALAEITPAPANVQAFGAQITAVLDKEFSGNVATFTATDPQASADGFTATIDWGDGTTSNGTVVADPKGGFDVTGTHTYTDTGDGDVGSEGQQLRHRFPVSGSGTESFLVTVTIHEKSDDSSASAVSLASVAATPPNIVTTSQNLTATSRTKFSGTLATFTDADGNGAANFKATIAWGDGTVSSGTVTADPNGGFDVIGSHTYRDGGTYQVLVGIRDKDGDSAVNLSTAIVADNTSPESLGTVASGMVQSAEYSGGLVRKYYQQFLGRGASATEIAYWVSALQHGATDEQIQAGFLSSQEYFQEAGSKAQTWFDALYQHLLNRSIDTAGATFWAQALAAGATQAEIALAIATSPERQSIVLGNYYQRLLGRSANQGEAAFWHQAFQMGATDEQVLAAFLQAPEYFQMHHANAQDWLFGTYQDLLSRQPDQPGLTTWLGVLRPGGGDRGALGAQDQSGAFSSSPVSPF